jgi:hypothetical protein
MVPYLKLSGALLPAGYCPGQVSSGLRLSTNRAASVDAVGCQYGGIAKGAREAFENLSDRSERERWLKFLEFNLIATRQR